jgi:protoheme IX farnesyltransferase
VDWLTCLSAVTGTALAAAAANTFNQVIEAPQDALMKRTQGRPLPTGRLSRAQALTFGAGATAASAAVLLAGTNPLTAALGMGNIALYALVYTPLKRVTELNTAVGAVVGAVPPLMGWAAATGSLAAVDPFLLAYILFAWQFPHFHALSWSLRHDYARGGYAMVAVADAASGARTSALALRHAAALSLVPLLSSAVGATSPMFAVEGLLLNAYFLKLALNFSRSPSDASARALFRASLWYLPLLLALMVFHAKHWRTVEEQVKLEQQVESRLLLAQEQGLQLREEEQLQAQEQQQHVAAAAAAAASAALTPASRGVSLGEAIEHAIGTARLLGRASCVHEVLFSKAQDAVALLSSSSSSSSRAACPVVVAEEAAEVVAEAVDSLEASAAGVAAAAVSSATSAAVKH